MADYDLKALSLTELTKMQKDIARATSTFEDRQKAEARAKVEAFARDLGYSLAQLVGTDTKSSRAPAAAKYRHPENPALTWFGQGRKPQWFVESLAAGKMAVNWQSAERVRNRRKLPPCPGTGGHCPDPSGRNVPPDRHRRARDAACAADRAGLTRKGE
jgi:DNA-binding protein H-NS